MSLDVGEALREGLGRAFERNGLVLLAAFVAVALLSAAANQSLNAGLLELAPANGTAGTGGDAPPGLDFPGADEQPMPFALPISPGAALAFALTMAVVAEAVRVVAVRTFAGDETATIPTGAFRRLVVATVNGAVGTLVASVLIVVGLVLFVLPGVFLAISFFFVRQEVAVADKNFVDAMADSWALASGNRVEVFALALVLFVVGGVGAVGAAVLAFVDPVAGVVVGAVAGAVVTVFGVASATRAYEQLRAERTEQVGALGPEDIDEAGGFDGSEL